MNSRFKSTGLYFRKMREAQGLSQAEVAERLGYKTSQLISNWERGLCSPPLNQLYTLVKLYKLNKKEVIDIFLKETKTLLDQRLNSSQKKASSR